MNIAITETKRTEHGFYLQATCNKVSALIGIYPHGLQVVCQNAMQKAWRGGGRHFHNAEAAMAHYRSGEMRAIIQAALNLQTPKEAF